MRLLTPNDVRTCEISVHRLREGYDTNAVDEILDSVADTMDVLAKRASAFEKRASRLEGICREHGIGIDETK